MAIWCGDDLTIENVTLDVNECLLFLRILKNHVLKLKNCRVVGNGKYFSQGIVMCDGGRLEAEDTHFKGLSTAIEAHAASDVILKSCTITACDVGIQVNIFFFFSKRNNCEEVCSLLIFCQ